MSDDPHAVAVLALLDANPNIVVVHDGHVPDDADPAATYVVAYFQARYRDLDELPARSRRFVGTFVTHSVATSASGSRIVAGNVRASLLDVRPTVTGRICFPIRQDQSIPPSRDESTGLMVMDQMDVWRLESVPA